MEGKIYMKPLYTKRSMEGGRELKMISLYLFGWYILISTIKNKYPDKPFNLEFEIGRQ